MKPVQVISSGPTAVMQSALEVSPCELAADPPKYDRKLVRVRGRVSLAFEDFSLITDDCHQRAAVWLALGGDIATPTTYCCGPHKRAVGSVLTVEGLRIPLKKNREFRTFWESLTARKPGCPRDSQSCYANDVTATFIGIYFAGKEITRSDGTPFYGGYGHMGMATLLAIEQIADVKAVTK
jgi:hypothetical protein